MKKRSILVKYTCKCGEYEFSGHSILELSPRQKISTQVHLYFKDFYGSENLVEANKVNGEPNNYLYNGGEVAVDHIFCQEISESDAEVLRRLNI
jgi:hypothetical protein